MSRIGIAIPTLNEEEAMRKCMSFFYDQGYRVVVSDDLSKDDTVLLAKRYGAFVPWHERRLGIGKSWKEALNIAWFSFDCDIIVAMDADHNYKIIPQMLKGLASADVVVGHELGDWKLPRKVTKVLTNILLGLKLTHPTCGFIAWRADVLKKMPWKHIKSNGDIFHVEMLYWAQRMGATIREHPFIPFKNVAHKYTIKRDFWRLWDFFRLCRTKYLWFWRFRRHNNSLNKPEKERISLRERLKRIKNDGFLKKPLEGATRKERSKEGNDKC